MPIETSNTIPYHRIEKVGTDLQYPGLLISHTPQLLICEIVLMDMKESKIFSLFLVSQLEDCVEISIVDAPFGMDAYCLYHASYTMNSREKQFIRELKELFADPPAERPI